MKIYEVTFRATDKEFQPYERYLITNKARTEKLVLNSNKGLIVLEKDLMKYWEYGWGSNYTSAVFVSGYESMRYLGEMDDNLFKPVIAEPDFVETQIKSGKNGEVIGYQG